VCISAAAAPLLPAICPEEVVALDGANYRVAARLHDW